MHFVSLAFSLSTSILLHSFNPRLCSCLLGGQLSRFCNNTLAACYVSWPSKVVYENVPQKPLITVPMSGSSVWLQYNLPPHLSCCCRCAFSIWTSDACLDNVLNCTFWQQKKVANQIKSHVFVIFEILQSCQNSHLLHLLSTALPQLPSEPVMTTGWSQYQSHAPLETIENFFFFFFFFF